MRANEKIIARVKEKVDCLSIPLKYQVGQEVSYIVTFYDFAHSTRNTGVIKEVRLKWSNNWPNSYNLEYKINSRWRDVSSIQGLVHKDRKI